MADATSSGVAMRSMMGAMREICIGLPPGGSAKLPMSGVSTPPGATQLMRMFLRAYSTASALVSSVTPPFDAQ
jgi:hypothetical protein